MKNRSTDVSLNSVAATDKAEKERAEMINAVVKELKFYFPTTFRGVYFRLPDNGSNTNVSAASTGAIAVT